MYDTISLATQWLLEFLNISVIGWRLYSGQHHLKNLLCRAKFWSTFLAMPKVPRLCSLFSILKSSSNQAKFMVSKMLNVKPKMNSFSSQTLMSNYVTQSFCWFLSASSSCSRFYIFKILYLSLSRDLSNGNNFFLLE